MQFIKNFLSVLPLLLLLSCYSDDQQVNGDVIAFYNVQNLFDTENDPHARDEEFLPSGSAHWTLDRYNTKLQHLAKCISQLGDQDGPEIIGLCEVENKKVLEDLTAQKELKGKYKIVHYDSPDNRGIDVALLYKSAQYKLLSSHSFRISKYKEITLETRDVLFCRFSKDKDTFMVLVNHWNSRRGGEDKTQEKRIALASFVKQYSDSLQKKHPHDLLMIMGDFNDEPEDKSITEILKAKHTSDGLQLKELYDPFYKPSIAGEGSHQYNREWLMYDQVIVNQVAVKNKGWHYQEGSAQVYHPDWLHYQNDPRKGPYKTYQGNQYFGGYSDHFPVYVKLVR